MNKVFSIEPILDKKLKLEPEGWHELYIEYSIEWVSNVSYLCWKIKGTQHIFRIPTRIVYEHHGLDYASHFEHTLKIFREDYLEWEKEEFPEDWMKKYQKMFHILIKT
jgi:hypothetical protein